MSRFHIRGRTALVTGGSAGIGLEITRRLLAEGAARVLVAGRDPHRLADIEAGGRGRVVGLRVDLADAADIDRLLARLPDLGPELSLVFNNAGTQQLTNFTDGDPAAMLPAIRAEIALNLTGLVSLSVGVLAQLSRQPSAALVNVSSGLALAPKKSSPVYCATKAGVRSFTRALRYQCEDALPHVRIVEALPPMVDTAMTRGRGRMKMSPAVCATAIVDGLKLGNSHIYVGKSQLLWLLMRISPALGHRVMRDG